MKYFNEDEIRHAIEVLKPNRELFEVRIIKGKNVLSGYFRDADTLIRELSGVDLARCNVYMTLQKLHEGCEARWQYERFINAGAEKLPTTSDNDIVAYRYIPIDLDPTRPAGISSSLDELRDATELRAQILETLKEQGYTKYIQAFSGNGYHILLPVDFAANKENEERVKQILDSLDENFSNAACKVDTTNYNRSRVFKLYGTLAQKGRSTKERPHRTAKILEVVE